MFERFKRRPGGAEMFERFTDRARRVIVLAQEEARQLSHNYVGTEHILLGLIREGDGVAAKALAAMRISLDTARREVEAIIGRGTEQPSGHIPFTPRTQTVLQFSSREAQRLGHSYVGTEHILLGLIREGHGVAVQVLVRRGIDIDLDRVRQQVIQGLHGLPGDVPPTGGSAFDEGEKTTAARETEQAADGGEIRLLRGEIERLRALLRAHDIDPGTGYVD
jgi:ATP-dependent Clp protease ATP-binding subunit ClpC